MNNIMNDSNLMQIVKKAATFVDPYKNNKEINETDKEACKQFLDYLNAIFYK